VDARDNPPVVDLLSTLCEVVDLMTITQSGKNLQWRTYSVASYVKDASLPAVLISHDAPGAVNKIGRILFIRELSA
jgi:hypothetical protein